MPRYQSQPVSQQPIASTEGQLFESLASRLTAFSRQRDDELDRDMAKKAKEQGLIDAQGKTTITLRDGSTIADEAWNQGALSSYEAAVKLDVADNITRISMDNPDDPEAFEIAAKGYAQGIIDGADDSIKPAIQDMLSTTILKGTLSAEKNLRTKERTEHGATLEAGLALSAQKAVDLAEDGDLTGMLESLNQSYEAVDALEIGGFLTPQQANKRREDLSQSTDKAVVMGQFNDARRAGDGDEFLTKFIDKPPKNIDLDEAYKYANIMDKTLTRDIRINKRAQAEELAQISRARGKQGSDLSIAVSRGEATEPDIEDAYQKKIISAEKRTSLIKELDNQTVKAEKQADQVALVTASLNADVPLSSRNTDHKNAVETYYIENIEEPFSDDGMNQTVELVNATTIIPKTAQELIQSHSKSGKPEQAVQAAELIARINEKTPQALSSIPADVKAFSLLVSRDVAAGMEPETAVELSRLSVYGTTEEEKKAFADEFKINTKNYREDNRSFLNDKIDDDFDPNLFDSQPATPLPMEAEFNLMVEQYLPLTKDLGQAKELAYTDLKNVWARTDINGFPEMSKYAPEAYYGQGDWMRNQLIADVKKQLDTKEDVDPKVVVDPRTAREANPSYFVTTLDEDGVATPILDENNQPMRWIPDYSVSQEGKEQAVELEEMLEAAKVEREQRTESMPEQPVRMRNPQGDLFEMQGTM